MDCTTIVRGGSVVTGDRTLVADVAILDGRIVAVGAALDLTAGEEIDASGLHVLPGVVDAHVHLNEPGRAEWEGFATGSAAVAAGGGKCFVDMPLNAHPPTIDAAAFDAKLAAALASSITDFAFWGGLVPGNLGELGDLATLGVVGFKAFMCPSGIDDFPYADDATLRDGMARAAELGLPVAVHAEDAALTTRLADETIAAGRPGESMGWRDFVASRPVEAELDAIERAAAIAEETGCSLHVVHVSSGRGVRLIAAAKDRGVDVTCETCPHYLLFSEHDLDTLGATGKSAPPLRPASEREKLWSELAVGSIDLIASDHSPAPAALKSAADYFAVWGGISGCQSLLPALLPEARRRGFDIARLVSSVTSGPAERFRLPGKGRIAPGYDADLAIADLEATGPLTAEALQYRHRHSPYVDRIPHAHVVRTIRRGATIWLDGRLVGASAGRLVRPSGVR
ncbi:MAG: allantoinase AllB [Gaiellaceae bacterium]